MAEPEFIYLPIVMTHAGDRDDVLETADDVAAKVGLALKPHGGVERRWQADGPGRTRAAVVKHLTEWAKTSPRNSVLLWMGHGQTSNNGAWLSTADSDSPVNGIRPADLADILHEQWTRRTADHHDEWVILVIEACGANQFVHQLARTLEGRKHGPRRLMMIGIGDDDLDGTSQLGTFKTALDETLTFFNGNFDDIRVSDLWEQLVQRLPGDPKHLGRSKNTAPFRVARPGFEPIATSLDNFDQIGDFIKTLDPQERHHFLEKARGGETGDELWYYTGREQEREQLSEWLRNDTDGMFVITGGPGSGKSAFLGNLLIYTKPLLRKMLIDHSYLDYVPDELLPPDDPFHAVIHLSGLDFDGVVAAIADKAHIPIQPDGGSAVDQLLAGIEARPTPLRMLVDALDEAQQPVEIAGLLLRRMGAMNRVSVVVGTRASTTDGIDQVAPREKDILQALGAYNGSIDPQTNCKTLRPDHGAIRRYATARLRKAVGKGLSLDEGTLDRYVDLISQDDKRQFIYARLAVHEIVARHQLAAEAGVGLRARAEAELIALLPGDHRDLFKAAVERLGRRSAAFVPLLQALAIMRGRGIPLVGDVWLSMARALSRFTSEELPDINRMDIRNLLTEAAPYIMVDFDGQEVYRLAHRTFQEHFEAQWSTELLSRLHAEVAKDFIRRVRDKLNEVPNPYIVNRLAEHVAEGSMWQPLADAAVVIDLLDPVSITAQALRTTFGREVLPPEIAGVVGAHQLLAKAKPEDRPLIRMVSAVRHTGEEPRHLWLSAKSSRVRGIRVARKPLHLPIPGLAGAVQALAVVPLGEGQPVVLASGDEREIRLWDLTTGAPIGKPLFGDDRGWITSLCVVDAAGKTLLASGDRNAMVRLWDPVTRSMVGTLADHEMQVEALATLTLGGAQVLASGSHDGTIRLWNPVTQTRIDKLQADRAYRIRRMVAVPAGDDRTLIASTSLDDWTIRLWDPVSGQVSWLKGHQSVVSALAVICDGGSPVLYSGSVDNTIRVWDPLEGRQLSTVEVPHEPIEVLAPIRLDADRTLLAFGARDKSVRLWDPVRQAVVGEPLAGHEEHVNALAELPLPDGRRLLASAGRDKTIRLWAPEFSLADKPSKQHLADSLRAIAFVTLPGGRIAVAGGTAGDVRTESAPIHLWDTNAIKIGDGPLPGHRKYVSALTPVTLSGKRTVLASGGSQGGGGRDDYVMRLWDLMGEDTVEAIPPLVGHEMWVTALLQVRLPDGRPGLASGSRDSSVRLWDATTGLAVGRPLRAGIPWVVALASVTDEKQASLIAAGHDDGHIRLWQLGPQDPKTTVLGKHASPLTAMVCARTTEDHRLVSGHADGGIRFWRVSSGQVGQVNAHQGRVSAMAELTVRNRPMVVSGGFDATVHLWDPFDATLTRSFTVDFPVTSLAAVGRTIARNTVTLLAIAGENSLVILDLTD